MFGDQARPEVTRFVTFGLRNGDPEKVKGRRSALSSGAEPWDQRHSFGAKFAGTVAAVAPAIAATPRAVAVATPTEWQAQSMLPGVLAARAVPNAVGAPATLMYGLMTRVAAAGIRPTLAALKVTMISPWVAPPAAVTARACTYLVGVKAALNVPAAVVRSATVVALVVTVALASPDSDRPSVIRERTV